MTYRTGQLPVGGAMLARFRRIAFAIAPLAIFALTLVAGRRW
jgi:hypothetical protein